MIKFVIEIKTDTEAFEGIEETPEGVRSRQTLEIVRLLDKLKSTIEDDGIAAMGGFLYDSNGEECGSVRLFDDDEEIF